MCNRRSRCPRFSGDPLRPTDAGRNDKTNDRLYAHARGGVLFLKGSIKLHVIAVRPKPTAWGPAKGCRPNGRFPLLSLFFCFRFLYVNFVRRRKTRRIRKSDRKYETRALTLYYRCSGRHGEKKKSKLMRLFCGVYWRRQVICCIFFFDMSKKHEVWLTRRAKCPAIPFLLLRLLPWLVRRKRYGNDKSIL